MKSDLIWAGFMKKGIIISTTFIIKSLIEPYKGIGPTLLESGAGMSFYITRDSAAS